MNKNERVFDRRIYPSHVIDTAIRAYKGIVIIKKVRTDDATVCTFIEKNTPNQIVINEFSNYLIELLNSKNDIL